MKKFKVGDKVIAKKNAPYRITTNGWTGFINEIAENGLIKVGAESSLREYWVKPSYFDLCEQPKIVITTDGKTTLARLYNGKTVTKTATAVCSPKDKFDFLTGAKLAFARLTEGELKKSKAFDWEAFEDYEIIVNCENRDETLDFLKKCEERGLSWSNDKKATDFIPPKNQYLECNVFHDKRLTYSDIKRGTKVVNWHDYITTDTEIKVGDKVKVIDFGQCYDKYEEWIYKNAPDYACFWCYGVYFSDVYKPTIQLYFPEFTVVAKAPHEYGNDMLYLIQDDEERCFLMSEKGLTKENLTYEKL